MLDIWTTNPWSLNLQVFYFKFGVWSLCPCCCRSVHLRCFWLTQKARWQFQQILKGMQDRSDRWKIFDARAGKSANQCSNQCKRILFFLKHYFLLGFVWLLWWQQDIILWFGLFSVLTWLILWVLLPFWAYMNLIVIKIVLNLFFYLSIWSKSDSFPHSAWY